jgi:hypothetical protein
MSNIQNSDENIDIVQDVAQLDEPQNKRQKLDTESMKLTDKLRSYYKYLYIIRIDDEDIFYCYTEDEAKSCSELLLEKFKSETNNSADCFVELSNSKFTLSKVNKGYIYNTTTPLNRIQIIKVNRLAEIYE